MFNNNRTKMMNYLSDLVLKCFDLNTDLSCEIHLVFLMLDKYSIVSYLMHCLCIQISQHFQYFTARRCQTISNTSQLFGAQIYFCLLQLWSWFAEIRDRSIPEKKPLIYWGWGSIHYFWRYVFWKLTISRHTKWPKYHKH